MINYLQINLYIYGILYGINQILICNNRFILYYIHIYNNHVLCSLVIKFVLSAIDSHIGLVYIMFCQIKC